MDVLTTLPPKKTVLKALLKAGSVFLHIDPRVKGVAVPGYLVSQPSVVLQIGYKLARPIPDLTLSEKGVTATLAFSNTPFQCRMPWNSVFAMVAENGRVMLWPSDMPAELLEDTDEDTDEDPDAEADVHGEGAADAYTHSDAATNPLTKTADTDADTASASAEPDARRQRAGMRVIQGGVTHPRAPSDDEPTDDGQGPKRPELHLVN